MHLGFIGMAGAGKSYWAQKFSSVGYTCFHCDDLIAAHLSEELNQPLHTLHDVGEWMGMPYDPGFAQRQERYLHYERQVMQQLVTMLTSQESEQQKFVFDLTGSAIYVGDDLLNDLRRQVTLVYFSVSADVHTQMLQDYLAQPRPLIWQDLFCLEENESISAALARCYPQLIRQREYLYEMWCDVKLAYHVHRQPGLMAEDLMQIIHAKLDYS